VKSFLGLASYYRKFVKDFAKISSPLTQLTKSSVDFHWGDAQQEAFQKLKDVLTSTPILKLPDNSKPFILHTDASNIALGVVLEQLDDDGKQRVVAYLSRTLNDAEKNYSTTERECLAIVWATKILRPYLYGQEFTVYTDHHSLVWLMTYKDASPRLLRWALQLQDFRFKIIYRPGSQNQNADALSRNPVLLINADNEMSKAQRQDPSLEFFFKDLKKPNSVFFLKDDVLYRRLKETSPSGEKRIKEVLVLPTAHRQEAMAIVHDDPLTGGHLGEKKSLEKLFKRFWWPQARKEMIFWIKSCPTCIARKPTSAPLTGKLQSIPVEAPFELVGIDVLGPLPTSKESNRFIIVFTDHFTKWAEAFAVPTHSAETVADLLVKHIFCRFGCPKKLLSDQGSEFMSKLVEKILEVMEIEKVRTSPYHPQTDGHTERMNRTLIGMLSAYVNEEQDNWDQILPFVLFAYRTSVHASTGCTPFFLLHGVDARFPVDVSIDSSLSSPLPVQEYIKSLSANLKTAYNLVRDKIRKAQQSQAYWYNKKAKPEPSYEIGDLVMQFVVRKNSGLVKKTKKFTQKWDGPYEIIQKLSSLTYRLHDPATRKKSWVAHVSRLKPYVSVLGRKNFQDQFDLLDDQLEKERSRDRDDDYVSSDEDTSSSAVAPVGGTPPNAIIPDEDTSSSVDASVRDTSLNAITSSTSPVVKPTSRKFRSLSNSGIKPTIQTSKSLSSRQGVKRNNPLAMDENDTNRGSSQTLDKGDVVTPSDNSTLIHPDNVKDSNQEDDTIFIDSSPQDKNFLDPAILGAQETVKKNISMVDSLLNPTTTISKSVAPTPNSITTSSKSVAPSSNPTPIFSKSTVIPTSNPTLTSSNLTVAPSSNPITSTTTKNNEIDKPKTKKFTIMKKLKQKQNMRSDDNPDPTTSTWTISSLNGSTVQTLLSEQRTFDISLPIDAKWRLSHIVDAAILGPTRRQRTYYYVVYHDLPETFRWLTYDQLRTYNQAGRIEREWDSLLAKHQKGKSSSKKKLDEDDQV
jgi:hypothetical protein